jgi:hypothetical protein
MADTVLSMARSMLGGALSKAASAAAAEMSLLMGVRKDIWYVCIDLIPIMNSKSDSMVGYIYAENTKECCTELCRSWRCRYYIA